MWTNVKCGVGMAIMLLPILSGCLPATANCTSSVRDVPTRDTRPSGHDMPAGREVLTRDSRVERAYRWLACQQEKKTGLVRSNGVPGDSGWLYDPDMKISNVGWTYDQALAIVTFLTLGDTKAACRCADAMLRVRNTKYHAWADGYNVCTRRVEAKPIAVGPNAWMGLALLRLYEATHKCKYLSVAEEVGQFLLNLQSERGETMGSIPGGLEVPGSNKEEEKRFRWTSTEHNADAVAFLAGLAESTGDDRYLKAALAIVEWLNREMWHEEHGNDYGYYYPGYQDNDSTPPVVSDFPERLDSQTWTILALQGATERAGWPEGITAHNGLVWIDQYRCRVPSKKGTFVGFAKQTFDREERQSFWTEGTAGYLLAARRRNHANPDLGAMLQSLYSAQDAQDANDGSVPYSIGISCLDVRRQFQPGDLVVADFESHPNRCWGAVDVHGDGQPDWAAVKAAEFRKPYSWYYESAKPLYDPANVHSGLQSFRLVKC